MIVKKKKQKIRNVEKLNGKFLRTTPTTHIKGHLRLGKSSFPIGLQIVLETENDFHHKKHCYEEHKEEEDRRRGGGRRQRSNQYH